MASSNSSNAINRRRAVGLVGTMAGGLAASLLFCPGTLLAQNGLIAGAPPAWAKIFQKIEQIIQAQGMFSDGVFSIDIDRKDITDVTLRGVPIKPAFQLNGTLYFQGLRTDYVVMNSDMALKASELNPFIDQLLAHNIVFQAEHQHFYDFSPMVWFIHFRAAGDPVQMAHGIKAALNVTSTPFPQKSPQNPKTSLPSKELGRLLGTDPQVAEDGVVNLDVPRKAPITLGGIPVNPMLNISAQIAFQPYGGDKKAAAAVDFALETSEINDVMKLMRAKSWDIGCLYNQETGEHPQLYFSHQFKTGDALDLAREIRDGLNHTGSKFKS